MGRKVVGILVGMLFFTTVIQAIAASPDQQGKPLVDNKEVFKNCYIDATGLLEYGNVMRQYLHLTVGDHSFVAYWWITWDDFNATNPTTVSIYSEKNGELLWNNEGHQGGVWSIQLFLYRGIYTNTKLVDGRLIIHLEGNTRVAITHTGD